MTPNQTPLPSVFSPLAKALLDSFSEGVVVFDSQGKILYANQPAREIGLDLTLGARELLPQLAELGGRLKPLKVGSIDLGEAMFLPGTVGPKTLAEREKAWDAFGADPAWAKARAESIAKSGQIVAQSNITLLRPAPFSPIQ